MKKQWVRLWDENDPLGDWFEVAEIVRTDAWFTYRLAGTDKWVNYPVSSLKGPIEVESGYRRPNNG